MTIDGCYLSACNGGIYADAEVTIENCMFESFTAIPAAGVIQIPSQAFPSSNTVVVSNCRFKDVTAASSYCIFISGTAGDGHVIENCRFEDVVYAIQDFSSGTSISTCKFFTVTGASGTVSLRGEASKLLNCYFGSGTTYGPVLINMTATSDIAEIAGNHFQDVDQSGNVTVGLIRVTQGRINCHDNIMEVDPAAATNIGIRLDTSDNYVTDNTFTGFAPVPIDDNGTNIVTSNWTS
jgi:hypothetical protein